MAKIKQLPIESAEHRVCDIPVGGCFRRANGKNTDRIYMVLQSDLTGPDNTHYRYSLCWDFAMGGPVKMGWTRKSILVVPVELLEVTARDHLSVPSIMDPSPVDATAMDNEENA